MAFALDGLCDWGGIKNKHLRWSQDFTYLDEDPVPVDDGKILYQPTVDLPQYNDPHRVAKEIRLREGF